MRFAAIALSALVLAGCQSTPSTSVLGDPAAVERGVALLGVALQNCPKGTVSDQDMANGIGAVALAYEISPQRAVKRLAQRSAALESQLRARGELGEICPMARQALRR